MKNRLWITGIALAGLLWPHAGRALEFGIHDQLEVGARITYFQLKDDERGIRNNWDLQRNFIGSIWGLEEKQSYIPKPYVQYAIIKYAGVGLSYDELTVKTVDWGNLEGTVKGGDGDCMIRGPVVYVFGRYPNSTRFTPFAELGYIYYFADFEEDPAWAAVGPGYRFEVDDTGSQYVAAGCDIRIKGQWQAGIYFRQLYNADVDARAYFSPGPRVGRSGSFPFDSRQFGLELSYRF